MKIVKIKVTNDRVLGSIEFDFTSNGEVINTIILAGENGVGKTRLLDLIYKFTSGKLINSNDKTNESYEFQVYFDEEELLALVQKNNFNIKADILDNTITFIIDKSLEGNYSKIKYINKDGEIIENVNYFYTYSDARKFLLSVYSTTQVNFNVSSIQGVTAKSLDEDLSYSLIQNEGVSTEIAQLLVDIDALDDNETSNWAKEHRGEVIPEELLEVRMKRFKEAFHYMFPSKKLVGIENISGKKEIIFEENGRRMNINKLSSGEKQIVFRGGFLLKDRNSNKGIVLIDEPEISLHPSWQMKICEFFRRLYRDSNNKDTNQIIMTTHSPFIIHNEYRKNDKVLILKKDDYGKYYGWKDEELIEQAFNIDWIIQDAKKNNNKTVIITEGKTDWMHMKHAYNKLVSSGEIEELNIEFLEYQDSLGDSRLYQLFEYISMLNNENKFICIFDRDKKEFVNKVTNGEKNYKYNKNNVYSMAIPVPEHRINTPEICIEHYYLDDDIKREKDGKRIYIGNEFCRKSGIHNEFGDIFCEKKNKCGADSYKIIDSDCFVARRGYEDYNIAMSKNDFADNIINETCEFSNININAFKNIFDVIAEIESINNV